MSGVRTLPNLYCNVLVYYFGLEKKFGAFLMGGEIKGYEEELKEWGPRYFWKEVKEIARGNCPKLYEALGDEVNKIGFWESLASKYVRGASPVIDEEGCDKRWERFSSVDWDKYVFRPWWVVYGGRTNVRLVEDGFRWVSIKGAGVRKIMFCRSECTASRVCLEIRDAFYEGLPMEAEWSDTKYLWSMALWVFRQWGEGYTKIIPLGIRNPMELMSGRQEYWLWRLRNLLIKADMMGGKLYE